MEKMLLGGKVGQSLAINLKIKLPRDMLGNFLFKNLLLTISPLQVNFL